jgi:hypothetical protein
MGVCLTISDINWLWFVQNYLGLLMVGLVVAYHFITADPKYDA